MKERNNFFISNNKKLFKIGKKRPKIKKGNQKIRFKNSIKSKIIVNPFIMIFSIKDKQIIYKSAESIATLISNITEKYHSFIFSGNTFYYEAFEALMTHLSKLKVKRLILSMSFAAVPAPELLKCLDLIEKIKTEHLIELDLSDNAISSEFPPFFYDFLTKCEFLKILKFHNCGLGAKGVKNLADALQKIKNTNNLEFVDISQNRLEGGACHIVKCLSNFSGLKVLHLQYNSIDEDSMDQCLKYLEKNQIQDLDLRDNEISQKGCEILGIYSQKMEVLKISDCIIGDDGLKNFIAGCLKKSNKKDENIDNNEKNNIENDQNLESTVKIDKSEDRTLFLDISGNDLTQESLDFIEKNIENTNIRKLNIFDNNFDQFLDLKSKMDELNCILITTDIEQKPANTMDDSLIEQFQNVL